MDQIASGNHKLNVIVVEEVGSKIKRDSLFEHSQLREIEGAIDSLHPIKKSLMLMGIGKWFIGHHKKRMWKTPPPFYVWKCGDCGAIAFGYPQGYKNDYTVTIVCARHRYSSMEHPRPPQHKRRLRSPRRAHIHLLDLD